MVTTLADRLAKKRDTQNWPSEIAKSKSLDKGKGRKDRSVHLPARHARGSWELDFMRRRFDRTRNSRSVAASRSTFSATASLHPPGRLEYAGTVSSMTSIALQKSRCSGAEPLQLAAVGKRLDDRTPSSDSARSSQLPCCAIRSARPAAWLRGPGSDRRPAFLRSRTDLDFQAWWGIIEGWELVGFEQAPS